MPANLRTVQAGEPPRQPLLNEISESLASATNDLITITGELRQFADSVFGSRPESDDRSGKGAATPSVGRASDLREWLSGLHNNIAQLRSQVARFGAL